MCGIMAIFSLGEQAVQKEHVETGLGVLHHRGPDNQKIWLSADHLVGLGHARLSIIDHHTGNQPISDASDSTQLIANGEFYDFEKIREELIGQGYPFKTKSDSEIALHLYNRQGVSCLKHLRGEFAFCLWDAKNQTLFAARDRFGVKLLFYSIFNNTLYLASEMKALFAAGVPAVWDYESYTSRAFMLRDRTLFKGVHQVPPGSFLLATKGGIRLNRYWDFDYPITVQTDKRDEFEISVFVKNDGYHKTKANSHCLKGHADLAEKTSANMRWDKRFQQGKPV